MTDIATNVTDVRLGSGQRARTGAPVATITFMALTADGVLEAVAAFDEPEFDRFVGGLADVGADLFGWDITWETEETDG